MIRRKYDPDPVSVWKKQHHSSANEEEEEEGKDEEEFKSRDFDYLLEMSIRSLTYERKEELLKKRDAKMKEYEILLGKTPADLWREDLKQFLAALQELEDADKEQVSKELKKMKVPMPTKGKKKIMDVDQVLPSPKGKFIFLVIVYHVSLF